MLKSHVKNEFFLISGSLQYFKGQDIEKTAKHSLPDIEKNCTTLVTWWSWLQVLFNLGQILLLILKGLEFVYKTFLAIFFIFRNKDFLLHQSVVICNHHFLEKGRWISPALDRIREIWSDFCRKASDEPACQVSWDPMSVFWVKLKRQVLFCLLPYTGGHFASFDQFF